MRLTHNQRSVLLVEGKDDVSTIVHLLRRHDLRYGDGKPPPPLPVPKMPGDGGKDRVLANIDVSVRSSTNRAAGFVLDANSQPASRWEAVASRLRDVGVAVPDEIPKDGFVGESPKYCAKVGVWLMPDNRRPGALEAFLADLVEPRDRMFVHAESATARAKNLGAGFSPQDTLKATVHAWLAWQEEPGLRYGTAIHAKYFRHDAPAARAFVDWFRRLYH